MNTSTVRRIVAVAAGGGFTSIRATIPGHFMSVYEDGERTRKLEYQLPFDSYATTFTKGPGESIDLIGPGRTGILGSPPGYVAANTPALGDIIVKVRDSAGTSFNVTVEESVNEL